MQNHFSYLKAREIVRKSSSIPSAGRELRLLLLICLALAAVAPNRVLAQSASMQAMEARQNKAPVESAASTSGGATQTSAAQPTDEKSTTYLRDILPIFMGKCSRCHNNNTRFVYNWLDYKTAFTDRKEIKRRVWDSWKGTYFKESMPIENSPESVALTEAERATIRDWVNSGGPKGVPAPVGAPKSKAQKLVAGKALFDSICAACHQSTGLGVPSLFPPLAKSDFLNADKARAIKTVLNGRQGEVVVNGTKFNNSMPSFPLSDDDIANVLTFVYNSFGNSGLEVNTEEVSGLRGQPDDGVGKPVEAKPNPWE